MNGGLKITLGAISFFVTPQSGLPEGYGDELINQLKDEFVHSQATAVYLAGEISRTECLPALIYAVTNLKEHWLDAVYAACALDGKQGTKAALDLLNPQTKLLSWTQLRLFEEIASAANPDSVEVLHQFGNDHPEFRVSCAFVINKIDISKAPEIITGWLADHKQDGMRLTIRRGDWMGSTYTAEFLLNAALQHKSFADPSVF